jgi:nucleotide-binding universal stress UspA family protein
MTIFDLHPGRNGSAAISELPNRARSEISHPTLDLLVYYQNSPIPEEIQSYAQYLTGLLKARLNDCSSSNSTSITFDDLIEEAEHSYDLVVFGEPCQSLAERLLSGSADCRAAARIPTSVLIARCPRWPLRKILFVTRGQMLDNLAVSWVISLAQPSRATVTVLALQPPMSAMDTQALYGRGLSDWLETDTPLGGQLRRIVARLVDWELTGMLRFRHGLSGWQIKSEMAEGDYDLIIVAADPTNWWLRRLLGELVNPLLNWVDRPVLVAKPAPV